MTKGAEIIEEVVLPERATTRVRARNGLRVIVRERYSVPRVGIAVLVKAGRRDEPTEQAGIAHLLRRLLEQRIATLAAEHAPDAVVESDVLSDRTVFRLTVPAEQAHRAMEIVAEVLQRPAFDPAAVAREVENLVIEDRVLRDRPDLLARERAMALAFDEGERRFIPVGDREPTLRTLTRDHVMAFFGQHFRGEKIVIAVVGAIATPDLLDRVPRLFGDLAGEAEKVAPEAKPGERDSPQETRGRQGASTDPPLPSPPSSQDSSVSVRYRQDRGPLSLALLTILHRVPEGVILSDREGDWPVVLGLVTSVLAEGRASRLALNLRERQRVPVIVVRAEPIVWDRGGAILVHLRMDPAERDRVLISYVAEAEKLRRTVLSIGEMQRARALCEKRWVEQTTPYVGEAEHLALAEMWGDFRRADRFLARVQEIEAGVLRAYAAHLFSASQMVIHEYVPQLSGRAREATEVVALLRTHVPGFGEREIRSDQILPSPEVPAAPEGLRPRREDQSGLVLFSLQPEPLREFSVFEGPRAFVREDRSRPVLSVGLFFQAGRTAEDATQLGVTELMLRALIRGARPASRDLRSSAPASAAEVAMRMEQLGAEIVPVNEPDFFGYVLTVLARNQEPALRLLLELIERPALADEEIRHEQAQILLEMRARREDPWERSRDLALRALYGEDSYGWPPWGREETLRALAPEQVRAWHARTILRQFPLVVIVGDTEGSALISTLIAREIRRQDVQRVFHATRVHPASGARAYVEEGTTQSVVQTFAFLGPSSPSEDEAPFRAVGVLVAERVCARAATCEVVVDARRLGGMIALTVATTPDRASSGNQAVEGELARLAASPPDEKTVRRVVHKILGDQATIFDRHSSLVLAYARAFFLSGRPHDVERGAEKLRAVTAADLHRVAAAYLVLSRAARGIVRPTSGAGAAMDTNGRIADSLTTPCVGTP